MELKVIKPFHGKVENRDMNKGDMLHSNDVERINALVGGGYCVIVSLSDNDANENDNNADSINADTGNDNYTKGVVAHNGSVYSLETLKAAFAHIGVNIAPNAKEKGVANAIGKLTAEQLEAFNEYLNENDNNNTQE